MYSIIKAVIESKRFELLDMLAKIDTIWIQGNLNKEQRDELILLAQENAVPSNSTASIQDQLDTMFKELEALKEQIRIQANRITELEGGTVETPEPEEWPEYVKPMSLRDSYDMGDKITYQGKHYVCKIPGTIWPPDRYSIGWELAE